MKNFLIFFGLLVLFAITASATDYCVASAGTTAVNGTYSPYGMCDDTSYKLTTGEMYIRHPGLSWWQIASTDCTGGTIYYRTNSALSSPPAGTYDIVDGGSPGAVVSSGACVPEFFGIHFEWIDLSSGLIAAVLAIALPMTLYKRKRATN